MGHGNHNRCSLPAGKPFVFGQTYKWNSLTETMWCADCGQAYTLADAGAVRGAAAGINGTTTWAAAAATPVDWGAVPYPDRTDCCALSQVRLALWPQKVFQPPASYISSGGLMWQNCVVAGARILNARRWSAADL